MLTPKFTLSQDPSFLNISIHVIHMKLSEVECHVEGDEFYFYSPPYYLRLHLPGEVRDDEHCRSQFDSDTGVLQVRLSKVHKGEQFEGLDLLTKLLTPKASQSACVSGGIEVLDTQTTGPENVVEEPSQDSSEELCDPDLSACIDTDNWFVHQTVHESSSLFSVHYGFAGTKTQPLNSLTSELSEMLDLKEPDCVPIGERRGLRLAQEEEMFSCEHYLADLYDDEAIQEHISFNLPQLVDPERKGVKFSEAEREKLLQLPRREYLIEDSQVGPTYLGLVDLVFASAFEQRLTWGESGVESDWTVCKLSSSLSWLDSFHSLDEVIIASIRRALTFPLFRHWGLIQRVLKDVSSIFEQGKTQVLKSLLSVHTILSRSEMRYPLNDIYVTDYCVWLQGADDKKIKSLHEALTKVNVKKSDVGFHLEEMEADAMQLMEESDTDDDKAVNGLIKKMDKVVRVTEGNETDSDDDTTDSEDTSDSDTTDSCSDSDDTADLAKTDEIEKETV